MEVFISKLPAYRHYIIKCSIFLHFYAVLECAKKCALLRAKGLAPTQSHPYPHITAHPPTLLLSPPPHRHILYGSNEGFPTTDSLAHPRNHTHTQSHPHPNINAHSTFPLSLQIHTLRQQSRLPHAHTALLIHAISFVPRLSPRAHVIIDDLCTRKEKRGESLVRDAILLREGVERPEISVGSHEILLTHYNNVHVRGVSF